MIYLLSVRLRELGSSVGEEKFHNCLAEIFLTYYVVTMLMMLVSVNVPHAVHLRYADLSFP